MCYIFIQPKVKAQATQKTMAWFGKSSKTQPKNDMESLGIRFEPIVFFPDRNEYELCIQLSGCPKDQVKVTYEKASGKLTVRGVKQRTEFVQEFSIPADCLAAGIYGRFRGEVLHVIMPRLLSEWPRSEDASSKQEEDDRKASSDREPTAEAGENRDELPAAATVLEPPPDQKMANEVKEVGGIQRRNSSTEEKDDPNASSDRENFPARVPPPPPPSDLKSTEEVKKRGVKDRDKLDQKSTEEVKERGGTERDKLTARVPAPLPSDQKSAEEVMEIGGTDRDKLPARVPASSPSPSPSPSDPKSTEKLRRRDSELFPEISAPPPSTLGPSRSVKELREKYQMTLSKTAAPPPPPPPPRAAAPWIRKSADIRAGKEDEKPPSTAVTESPSADQNKSKQKDHESDKPVVKSQKNEKKSEQDNAKNAKTVTESKDKEKKPSGGGGGGGNEMLGLVAKVKERGKAAATAAMKEENRLVVMIGAAVLTIVVIGASLRSKRIRN